MMKYNEIANIKSEKMQCSVEALSSFLEDLYKSHPEEVEKELIKQVGIFNNKHFEEKSAEYIINRMKPSIGNKTPWEVLRDKGITAENAKEKIDDAYHKARNYALERGLSAPTVSDDYTNYDCYVVLAMCAMDYWYDCMEDCEKTCMIAYQWLADVDADANKVWDYFF